jgi:hypothetical protein
MEDTVGWLLIEVPMRQKTIGSKLEDVSIVRRVRDPTRFYFNGDYLVPINYQVVWLAGYTQFGIIEG